MGLNCSTVYNTIQRAISGTQQPPSLPPTILLRANGWCLWCNQRSSPLCYPWHCVLSRYAALRPGKSLRSNGWCPTPPVIVTSRYGYDSSVGLVTKLPESDIYFYLCAQTDHGNLLPPVCWVSKVLFSEAKRSEREADHLPPSMLRLRKNGAMTLLHASFLMCCDIYLTATGLTPGGSSTHLLTNSTQDTENGTYITINN
jgi:hypothetical protein